MGRPISVVVGPLATADADGAGTSQKVAGAQYLVLNGALTDGTTANNVCQSQTPTGVNAAFVLNGTLCSSVPTGSAVAYLGQNSRIYFTSGSDISNRTITINGLYQTAAGLSAQTETLTGPNASIVASQKLYYQILSMTISNTAAGAITVGRAGVATFDTARRVIVTSGGNDTGITFTLVGTDWANTPISEVRTGASGAAAQSVLSYKTLVSVLSSGAAATTVEVGTNAVADSPWVPFDAYGSTSPISIQCTPSAAGANYTVQQTLDNPTSYGNLALLNRPDLTTWVNHPDSALVGATTTVQGNYAYQPALARVTLNSGSGSVTATFIQAGLWA